MAQFQLWGHETQYRNAVASGQPFHIEAQIAKADPTLPRYGTDFMTPKLIPSRP
jgi:hypothetical protein